MFGLISKKELEKMKNTYTFGTRVELVKMKDIQAPPIGTQGMVKGVDDTGTIFVNWDNGSTLGVLYKEDKVKIVK